MGKIKQTFSTQNMALSCTLHTCGVPFAKNDKGFDMPCSNVYTREMLEAYGHKGKPWEQACRDAVKQGQRGSITYHFILTPDATEIIKAWDETAAAMSALEGQSNIGAYQEHLEELQMTPKEAGAFACQLFKNRIKFAEIWKLVTPKYEIATNVKTKIRDGKTIITGALKQLSVNADEKTKRRLGLR